MTEAANIITLEEERPAKRKPRAVALPAVVDNSPMSRMMAALDRGVSPDTIGQMMALQREWEADEARKAFNEAFAAFKAEAVQIVKNRDVSDGPLKGKKYAELFSVVDAVTPALSLHGLSTSWKTTKDERDWIEVTCTLKHAKGHAETVSFGGPPDDGGAKNKIQARASTVTYLERYTLKMILGVAEAGDDSDGNAAKRSLLDTWVDQVNAAETIEAVTKVSKDGAQAFTKAKDVEGYRVFAHEAARRKRELAEGGK